MFMSIVDAGLCGLLVLTGSVALYLGVFKAHRKNLALGRKALYGVFSWAISVAAWYLMYIPII